MKGGVIMAKHASTKKGTRKRAKKSMYKKPGVIASYSEVELSSGCGEGKGKPVHEPIISLAVSTAI